MKPIKVLFFCFLSLVVTMARSQAIGIGTNAPSEKLDVNGKVKTNAIILNSGGSPYDFLMKSNANGDVGFKKATGGLGLRYIICVQGSFPPIGGSPLTTSFLGEVKLFAGNFAPSGWSFCEGQLIQVASNTALFAIITTTYGGNGQTNFALPDLRSTKAIGRGTASPAGYNWDMGEKQY